MTPAAIEPATFRFVAQHLNHCATAVPRKLLLPEKINPINLVALIAHHTPTLTPCSIISWNFVILGVLATSHLLPGCQRSKERLCLTISQQYLP